MKTGFEVYPPRAPSLRRVLAIIAGIALAGGLIIGTIIEFLP